MIPLISIFLIFFLNLLVYTGLSCLISVKRKKKNEIFIKASVILAAKDEEQNIKSTAENIIKQKKYISEMIVVDDFSSDNTYSIIKSLSDSEYKIMPLKNVLPAGKKNALTTGIKETNNEYILITDADCKPEQNWVKSFLEKFSEGYDMIFGIAPYKMNETLTGRISAFENLRGSIISFSALFFKLPYSAAARSFGFRKSSFERISGYQNTMQAAFGDDDLLLREAVKNNLKIGAVTEEGSFVFTEPKNSFKEYIRQRKRHTRSSFYYQWKNQFVLGVWHLVNLSPLLLTFFTPMNYAFILPLLSKLILDCFIILFFQHRFGYRFNLFQIIYLQIIYEVLIVFHFINALQGDVRWKE